MPGDPAVEAGGGQIGRLAFGDAAQRCLDAPEEFGMPGAVRAVGQVGLDPGGVVDGELAVDVGFDAATCATVVPIEHHDGNPPRPARCSRRMVEYGEQREGFRAVAAAEQPQRSAEAAFNEFVLPEVDVLYRVALSITRNAADAEDLVQDTHAAGLPGRSGASTVATPGPGC